LKYSIDTSAILHAWRRAYPPDLFPSLWEKFDGLIDDGCLIATDEVLVELEKMDDEVLKWARRHEKMFIPLDEDIEKAVQEVLRNHARLLDTRKNRSGADAFVIAVAKVRGCKVVTQEPLTGKLSRPNIPDVCAAMSIPVMSVLQLIREQGWVL